MGLHVNWFIINRIHVHGSINHLGRNISYFLIQIPQKSNMFHIPSRSTILPQLLPICFICLPAFSFRRKYSLFCLNMWHYFERLLCSHTESKTNMPLFGSSRNVNFIVATYCSFDLQATLVVNVCVFLTLSTSVHTTRHWHSVRSAGAGIKCLYRSRDFYVAAKWVVNMC